MIEGEYINLDLFNMAGMEDYQRLRPLSYIDANVFLICFSLVSPPSFNNVRDIWVPEVMHHCPHVPIFLVGTKLDLRKEEEIRTSFTTSTLEKNKRYISYDEGRELAKKIGALSYFECSSESHLGHDEIFREAVNSAVKNESFKLLNKEKKSCKIL